MNASVYIGSGNNSVIERNVLVYSIRRHTSIDIDINVFYGTDNQLIKNDATLSLDKVFKHKGLNHTEFSLYRFLIPQLMNYKGKAIYLDSDTLNLSDINELFSIDMGNNTILCKQDELYGHWSTSVMLMDCGKLQFNIDDIVENIRKKNITYENVMQLSNEFTSLYNIKVGEISPDWNRFDFYDSHTKILHFTDLTRQPWLHPEHPYADIWYRYFIEARKKGVINDEVIVHALSEGNVHPLLPFIKYNIIFSIYRFYREVRKYFLAIILMPKKIWFRLGLTRKSTGRHS